jgi:UDP-N-acetylmuramyl pentapeptide phosphotransferase/UDP-N-acetylglucosamine-1-phosphate transferase
MSQRRQWLPRTSSGVVVIGLSLAALSLWVILPMVTVRYRDIYPITNSWVMPTTGGIINIIVAVLNVYMVWWRGQRAWLNIFSMVVLVIVAVIALMVLVGGFIDQVLA